MPLPSQLPISQLIAVQVNLSPAAAQAQSLSNALLLGSSDVIDTTERMRSYPSVAAVAADFGTVAPEYLAALNWFAQSPQPTALLIGRWAQTATAARLRGGLLSATAQALANFTALATPGFTLSIDGIPYAVAPGSFAGAVNINGVAAIVQTALNAIQAGVTCVWNAVFQRFEIEDSITGPLSTLSLGTASAAVGNYNFSGNPANTNIITVGGTAITFVTAGAVGNQVNIGANLAATLVSLAALINGSADVNLTKFIAVVNPASTKLYLTAKTPGVGGNALTIASSQANPTVSGATLAGATAQDASVVLGLTVAASGSYVAPGIAAESAVAAVTIFDTSFGQQWYGLSIVGAASADHLAVAPYIEASNNKHFYGVSTQDAGTLSAISTTDIAYLLSLLLYNHTFVSYSSSNAYSAMSILGRALTVNYNGNNTTITLMYKQEPGIVPENLNATQLAALQGKNCNSFVAFNNNTAIILNGVVCSGSFIDITNNTDWLAVTIQTAVYNVLYTSPTKIPQTDAGNNLLTTAIEAVCSQGVVNGMLAPGLWQATGFGTLHQNDYLPKGFYVYAPPVASQLQSDRAARKSVAIQVAVKLAGAIHTVNVQITVNR